MLGVLHCTVQYISDIFPPYLSDDNTDKGNTIHGGIVCCGYGTVSHCHILDMKSDTEHFTLFKINTYTYIHVYLHTKTISGLYIKIRGAEIYVVYPTICDLMLYSIENYI